jgi:CrcB protein
MSAGSWVGVFILGGAGAVLRFLVDGAVAERWGGEFPLGTLVVNLSGAVALGVISGLTLSHDAALLAGAAAIGSYTTFSTWMFETERLVEEGASLAPAANLVVSLALGIGAAVLGRAVGGLW